MMSNGGIPDTHSYHWMTSLKYVNMTENSTSKTTTKPVNDFIRVYDDVLTEDECEKLVLTFDTSKGKQRVDNKVIHFTELNLNEHCNSLVPSLVSLTREVLDQYKFDVWESKYFPTNQLAMEQFRIKCYNNDGKDQFDTHVDVGNYLSARRYLAFLYYLNDDFEGGETSFVPGIPVTPKKGSVVVFPPFWMFPHQGSPVTSGPSKKYIMSTYLHYT